MIKLILGDELIKMKMSKYRYKKKLSLRKLESLTGIDKDALNRIENGVKSPTLEQLEVIATILDVKMTDLFDSEKK